MKEIERKYEIDSEEGLRQLARILERQGYSVSSGVYQHLERGHISLGHDSSGHNVTLGQIDLGCVSVYIDEQQGRELAEFLEQLDLVGLVEQHQEEFQKRVEERSFPNIVITLTGLR